MMPTRRPLRRPGLLFMALLAPLSAPVAAQTPALPLMQYDCVMDPAALIHLSPSAPGVLDAVLVRRGDPVTKGQVVARIRAVVEEASIKILETRANSAAEIDAQEARVVFSKGRVMRARQLVKDKAQSVSQLEEFEFDYVNAQALLQQARLDQETARAELARARTALEQTIIRSPVDGYVLETTLKPGEYATGERPVMQIVQLDPLLVEAFLPVDIYASTHVGQAVAVLPDAPVSGQYTTTITVVDRVFDTASRTFGVQAELPNPNGLLPAGHRCLLELVATKAVTPAPSP
jgi:RND family efflux transporter MFP subunit